MTKQSERENDKRVARERERERERESDKRMVRVTRRESDKRQGRDEIGQPMWWNEKKPQVSS